MTTPALSRSVRPCPITKRTVERVYITDPFDTTIPAELSYAEALTLLDAGRVVPSTTNIMKTMGHDFSGWYTHMMGKHFRQALNDNRAELQRQIEFAAGDPTAAQNTARDFVKYLQGEIYAGQQAAPEYAAWAAQRGTDIHAAIEDYYGGVPEETIRAGFTHPDRDAYFDRFLEFDIAYGIKMKMQEVTVYGTTKEGYGYAGTVDAVAEANGQLYILDWKTSSKMRETVALQLTAAANAHSYADPDTGEIKPFPYGGALLGGVLLTPQEYGLYEVIPHQQTWETFQALRAAWNFRITDGAFRGREVLRPIEPQFGR